MGVHKKFFNYRPKVLESITESMRPRNFVETDSVRKYLQARAVRVMVVSPGVSRAGVDPRAERETAPKRGAPLLGS